MRRFFATLVVLMLVTGSAFARRVPLPPQQWDEDTQVTLARAMVGEADWHRPDHIAIAYVLARRWRLHSRNRKAISFRDFIHLYSSPLKQKTKRAEWVQQLPWGPMPGPYERRWDRVRRTVRHWGEGRVKDPCPNAMHWGGTMDRPSGHWRPVNCGQTRNIFYEIQRDKRSKPSA